MDMQYSKIKAIMHLVRAQILMELNDCTLTPRQIAILMPDVPLGTVYRHINILLQAGLIKIVGERRVKGTVERQFTLVESASFLTESERNNLQAEDIMGLITVLTGVIQSAFHRYTLTAELPPKSREISFITKSLYLTKEEYSKFLQQLTSLLGKVGRQPSREYERRLIGYFSVPDVESNVISTTNDCNFTD